MITHPGVLSMKGEVQRRSEPSRSFAVSEVEQSLLMVQSSSAKNENTVLSIIART